MPPEVPHDEDELVRLFAQLAGPLPPGVVLGIGGDAALLRPPPGCELVWTVDLQEEDVDFRRAWLSLEEIGARAVAAALSDLAAAAAQPLGVLLSLGSAASSPAAELLALFRGASSAARGWGAPVAGGDVTRRFSGIGVGVTALGAAPAGRALRRDGARPGDELWVTGTPGRAAAGLRLLAEHGRDEATRRDPAAVRAWVAPVPRLAEASWLAGRAEIRAALDLSDGLARDLPRLCAASGVGAALDERRLRQVAHARGDEGLREALAGGEDFELLLAAPPGALGAVAAELQDRLAVPLRRIGDVVREAGVRLHGGGQEWQLAPSGFDHLQGPLSAASHPGAAGNPHTGRGSA